MDIGTVNAIDIVSNNKSIIRSHGRRINRNRQNIRNTVSVQGFVSIFNHNGRR